MAKGQDRAKAEADTRQRLQAAARKRAEERRALLDELEERQTRPPKTKPKKAR